MGDRREVKVDILGDAASYKKAMSEAESHTGKTGAAMTGIFAGIGLGATQLATEGIGKVVDFLGDSAKVARDAEVTTTRLTTALDDNVKGFKGTAAAMEPAIDAGRRLGFTGDELRASLASLVTVTKDTKQATADQAAAEDLARARGIDLATATNIVIKAQEGNVGALKKLGIIVPAVTTAVDELKASHTKATPEQLKAAQAADKQATAVAALAAVHKSAQGQAEAYAATESGSMAVAGNMIEGIQEKLGATLNQLIVAILPPLIAGLGLVAGWFGTLVAAVEPFIPIVKDIVGQYLSLLAVEFQTVGTVISTIVFPAIQRIVTAAIPPLIAAFTWLAHDVLPSVRSAMEFIASHVIPLLGSAVGWIVKNVLPPLEAAFGWIVKNVLPPVVAALQWVANTVLPALGTGFSILTDTVIPAISNAFQVVGGVVGRVFGGVTSTIRSVINGVIGMVNGMIRAIDDVQIHVHLNPPAPLPGINFDWGGAGIRQLPYLHSGGEVPGSPGADVLAVLQAGERVLPRGGGGGAPTVIVNINGGLIDGPTVDHLTNEIVRRLRLVTGP